jgi:endonuclease/exonuclease/phosphatase family metal-dependent hydrolase
MSFGMLHKMLGSRRGRSRSVPLRLESLEGRLVPSHSPVLSSSLPAEHKLQVMTYNLNNGSDLIPLLAAKTPKDVVLAVSQVLAEVKASDIPDRAAALAHVIEKAHPDLIGVQEASIWSVNGVTRYDVLGSLMSALAKDGQHYAIVSKVNAFGGQLPDAQGEIVGLQDQNAILARTDLPRGTLHVSNPQSGNFTAHVSLPIPGAPQPVPAIDSWQSIDVQAGDEHFRFVNTHLDSISPIVNDAQAKELAANLSKVKQPVVLVGDFNALANGAGSATYTDLIQGGFHDVWSQAHPDNPGFTWGQADAASPDLQPNQRIDLVLYRGSFDVDGVRLVGNHKKDQTPSGLWPSDHRGVEATLELS